MLDGHNIVYNSKSVQMQARAFEYTQSISKQLTGSVDIGNTINNLMNLLDTFPKGLEVDLEGSITFPTLYAINVYQQIRLV